jgi:diguanylate cyclase (GGDEF)-like protein/PAS domain S-box-containing protein
MLSGLLAAFLLAMSGRTTRIEALVAQRTEELLEANRSLRESEARFHNLADTVPVLIWLADPDGRGTYFNRPWIEFTGRTLEQELNFGWSEQVHPEDREDCLEAYGQAVRARRSFEIEYRIRRYDGAYRWVLDRGGPRYTADGVFAGFIGTAMDVTARRTAQAEVHHLAYHDALTGVPNRRLLLDRLRQALAQAERRGHALAVLYADLDHFKTINDTLGHAAGDALLRQAVVRLHECLRDEDTVARVGGDEFLIVLPSLTSGDAAVPVAQKILAALAAPFLVAEREVRITVSLGIGVYPRDGADPETLIRNADAALYRAKQAGRNAYRFYR